MLLFSSLAKSIFHTTTFSCNAIRNSRIFSFTTATNGFPSTSSISTNPFTIIKSHKHILFHYLNNRTLDQARAFFDQIPSPHVSLYTIMLHAYASNHRLYEAIDLFRQIPFKDVVSWNSMIKGCLHCGDIVTARKLFDEMPHRTVVSWTTLVDGLLRLGVVEEAEALFWAMDPVDRDVAAWNAMIHGYCGNGRVDEALRLFRQMPSKDVISWSCIIAGLDHNGESEQALVVFRDMVASGVCPSSVTLVCGLSAAAKILAFHVGIQIHCSALKLGDYRFDEFVSASLVTFYSCCKQIESACWVFCEALCKNVVVWTALLTGYGFNDKHLEALEVFREMMRIGVIPNESSFTSALNSCCGLEDLERGQVIHAEVVKMGLESGGYVGGSLVVMYSKCGCVSDAVSVFKEINEKSVVSWNTVIVGCAQHGCGMWVLAFFNQMLRQRVDPDGITLTGLLSACSRSGMLQKARCIFRYFGQERSVTLTIEHYASMVDVLGRCGELEEAEALVMSMPMKANSMVWLALLSACRKHSNLDVAERAANRIFEMEPDCSAAYVLLSNLYASSSRWAEVALIRKKMKHNGVVKQPGSSWLTLKGKKHKFLSADRSHPLTEKIYQKLEWLGVKLKELGYVPDQQFALHDVETEQKEEMLSYHSERLAIAFALLSTVEGSTITIMKNLRVCGDCHSAIKLMTHIVDREIVVRDSSRFHHFKNGICSCGDYW
ncbi:pentatricopeptide repeat-containing protein At5g46460, mitochondrial [Vigna radiata var. radiata]|uniref:Pentatricopeptide repeat-containing protein At5g46460, mitochondrial n=1 Tax=Vigna radiata var. radiata TaxID=3916 RepID=A0A1S3UKV1_VIGRR|nr:pentatricopeptide repeat-containing protein At5g46460, mitochondrial [Vigna radiata var. radiata]